MGHHLAAPEMAPLSSTLLFGTIDHRVSSDEEEELEEPVLEYTHIGGGGHLSKELHGMECDEDFLLAPLKDEPTDYAGAHHHYSVASCHS